MSNAIGTGSVILSANADGLSAGLMRAQQQVEQWASRVEARAAKTGGKGAGGGLLGGILFGGGRQLGGMAINKASEALDRLGEVANTGEIAQAFGTTGEKMSGLLGVMKAAGSPIKESIESLTQFGSRVADGMNGGTEETRKFFNLLGIAPQAFAQLDASERFYTLFAAIEQVNDPLQKMSALSLAFGTDGMKLLLPLLNKSSEQLRAQASAYSISSEKIAEARIANASYTEAMNKLDKAWTDIVVSAAPTIDIFATQLPAAFEKAGNAIEKLVGSFVNLEGKQGLLSRIYEPGHFQAGLGKLQDLARYGTNVTGATVAQMGMWATKGAEVFGGDFAQTKAGLQAMIDQGAMSFQNGVGTQFAKAAHDAWVKREEEKRKQMEAMGTPAIANVPPKVASADPMRFAAAIQAGSREAYSLEIRRNAGLDAVKKTDEKQLEATKQLDRTMQEVLEAVREGLNLEVK